jgi:hypothetical protein
MTCPPDAFNSGRDLIILPAGGPTIVQWHVAGFERSLPSACTAKWRRAESSGSALISSATAMSAVVGSDPAYKDDVPVGTPDAHKDARRAGGSRQNRICHGDRQKPLCGGQGSDHLVHVTPGGSRQPSAKLPGAITRLG